MKEKTDDGCVTLGFFVLPTQSNLLLTYSIIWWETRLVVILCEKESLWLTSLVLLFVFYFQSYCISLCISLLLHDTRGSKRKDRNRKRHFLKRIKNNGGICLYVSLGCRRVIMWHIWIIMTYKNKNLVYIGRNSFLFQVKSCLHGGKYSLHLVLLFLERLFCSLVKVTLEHSWKQNEKELFFWEWCPSDETVE